MVSIRGDWDKTLSPPTGRSLLPVTTATDTARRHFAAMRRSSAADGAVDGRCHRVELGCPLDELARVAIHQLAVLADHQEERIGADPGALGPLFVGIEKARVAHAELTRGVLYGFALLLVLACSRHADDPQTASLEASLQPENGRNRRPTGASRWVPGLDQHDAAAQLLERRRLSVRPARRIARREIGDERRFEGASELARRPRVAHHLLEKK